MLRHCVCGTHVLREVVSSGKLAKSLGIQKRAEKGMYKAPLKTEHQIFCAA